MADDDDHREYRWEGGYEKTWEAIRENEDGFLESNLEESLRRAKRRKLEAQHAVIRLGVMRHLYIILDLSEAMVDQDLKPTRQICSLKLLDKFVDEFFDQNPISQLGLIITRNKRAEKISELGGNPKCHKDALKKALDIACTDEPSLVNALELACQTLKNMPSHSSREILIILGSLTTCDPGDVNLTVKVLKSYNIRCSIVGLAAELHVCKLLSKQTGGSYGVILDDSHFLDLLIEHVTPPPAAAASASSLIRMGFPQRRGGSDVEGRPALCMCHLDSKTNNPGIMKQGYFCPQCQSKYCELPVECKACGLTLVSAPHLARSYHYFFSLDPFTEVKLDDSTERLCSSCQKAIKGQIMYECRKCTWQFCFDCDLFLHETIHTCPGCTTSPHILQQQFDVS